MGRESDAGFSCPDKRALPIPLIRTRRAGNQYGPANRCILHHLSQNFLPRRGGSSCKKVSEIALVSCLVRQLRCCALPEGMPRSCQKLVKRNTLSFHDLFNSKRE